MPTWAISAARPIRIAWLGLVLPALALNYLGQGALLLAHPRRSRTRSSCSIPPGRCCRWSPRHRRHHHRQPGGDHRRLLAHAAGDAARPAAALSRSCTPRRPRRARSTSRSINWLLLAAVILVVVLFETSSALAAAYGIAVTGDMVITSCLLFIVAWKFWRWSPAVVALVIAPFLAHRARLPRRERPQDPPRRLVPAAGRRRPVHR